MWPPAQTRRRDTDDAGGDKPRPYVSAFDERLRPPAMRPVGAALVAARGRTQCASTGVVFFPARLGLV